MGTAEGRKLKEEHDNPINNMIHCVIEVISPIFYKLNITPNQVTLISFIFSLASIHNLMNSNLRMAAFLWGISYIFDCLDGYMARKYNLISKYGDYYDHISDIIGFIGLIIVFWKQKKYKTIKLLLVMLIPLNIHISCQENIYDKKEESKTLNSFNTCWDPLNMIRITRWFGDGSYNLLIILLILKSDFH